MDQYYRKNTRPATASPSKSIAASNISSSGPSLPAAPSFGYGNKVLQQQTDPPLPQNRAAPKPFRLQATTPTPAGVTQLYQEETLADLKERILTATGSGREVLTVNRQAQEELAADNDSGNKKLAPYFTSMGFEVEFAQQPKPNEHVDPVNPLNKAHVTVSRDQGFALYNHLHFIVETDAQLALEFVTAPLLAPLEAGNNNIVPVKDWENNARRAIEFSLRDISSQGKKSVRTIISGINEKFELNLPVPEEYAEITYGDISKFGPDSFTNAQLNFMTTLQHYMEVNRGEDGSEGDAVTEKIYQKALEISYTGENTHYIYALCQKIREIPSTLVDHVFSMLLHHDTNPDDALFKKGENKRFVETAQEQQTYRTTLASAASHIKDQSTLWLKASLHQILAAIPPGAYEETVWVTKQLAAPPEQVVDILKDTKQYDALLPFYHGKEHEIGNFISAQLRELENLPDQQHKVVSDIDKKPDEQKTVTPARKEIIGARPDTYVPVDKDIANESLFLVETRKTSPYLGLTVDDRYKKGV